MSRHTRLPQAPAAPAPPSPTRGAAPRPAPGARVARTLPTAPLRVLDAPDLVDDYYLNTLAWSSANTLAVGLGRDVYLWSASDGSVSVLPRGVDGGAGGGGDDYVSSVAWAADGRHLAVGVAGSHSVQLWDVAAGRQLRVLRGHAARVGSLAWAGASLASGGRDSAVLTHDVRARDHVTARLTAHTGEVCGLAWDAAGELLASGGNDNAVHVWRPRAAAAAAPRPVFSFTDHSAAVKALAWCPFQPAVLATGGGAAGERRGRGGGVCAGARGAPPLPPIVPSPLTPRPPHQRLQHAHRRPHPLGRHRRPGVRPRVVARGARAPLLARLLGRARRPLQLHVPVEVPLHDESGASGGPRGARAAPGRVAGRRRGGHRGRGRDAAPVARVWRRARAGGGQEGGRRGGAAGGGGAGGRHCSLMTRGRGDYSLLCPSPPGRGALGAAPA